MATKYPPFLLILLYVSLLFGLIMFGGLLHLAIPTEKIILEFYDYSIKHGLVSNKAFEYIEIIYY